MALHPEMKSMLDQVAAWREVHGESQGWADERVKIEQIRTQIWKRHLVDVASVENTSILGPAGEIPIRIYRPDAPLPAPTVLYFHGGAFAVGDLNSHEAHARYICNQLGAVVVAVDYRLAPEHKFPAGFDDCYASYLWALENIDSLGGDRNRIGFGGDSAGGSLSLGVAVKARDEGLPVAATMLAYGVFDLSDDSKYQSIHDYGSGYGLKIDPFAAEPMPFYLGDDAKKTSLDFRASPLLADLTGIAPAVIVVGECDPLADQSTALDEKMRAAGIRTIYRIEPGLIHSFMNMSASPVAVDATTRMIADFGTLLNA